MPQNTPAAAHRYYMRRKADFITAARERRCVRMAWLAEQKKGPCVDCGGCFHPAAMDFDHRPGIEKLGTVSGMAYAMRPLTLVEAEIAKCDLRCANCHRIRHVRAQPP